MYQLDEMITSMRIVNIQYLLKYFNISSYGIYSQYHDNIPKNGRIENIAHVRSIVVNGGYSDSGTCTH